MHLQTAKYKCGKAKMKKFVFDAWEGLHLNHMKLVGITDINLYSISSLLRNEEIYFRLWWWGACSTLDVEQSRFIPVQE